MKATCNIIAKAQMDAKLSAMAVAAVIDMTNSNNPTIEPESVRGVFGGKVE